ncbi:MAG: hypothetical protein LBK18_03190, partial [Prevotellaceae bacterium]|nr:hypothetical protein [Prevotellaceae bacterium]
LAYGDKQEAPAKSRRACPERSRGGRHFYIRYMLFISYPLIEDCELYSVQAILKYTSQAPKNIQK